MRVFLTTLLLLMPLVADADAIYREVRPDGSVHYTDRPADKHAKPLALLPPPGGAARSTPAARVSELMAQAARYSVRVESPTPEQMHPAGRPLVAAASVMPGLVKGFRLLYLVNGSAIHTAPTEDLSLPLPALPAGTHELVVVLLDTRQQEIARSAPTRFQLAPSTVQSALK